jgi:hypothetical protein
VEFQFSSLAGPGASPTEVGWASGHGRLGILTPERAGLPRPPCSGTPFRRIATLHPRSQRPAPRREPDTSSVGLDTRVRASPQPGPPRRVGRPGTLPRGRAPGGVRASRLRAEERCPERRRSPTRGLGGLPSEERGFASSRWMPVIEALRVLGPRPPKRKGSLGAGAAESTPPKGSGPFGLRARGRRSEERRPLTRWSRRPSSRGRVAPGPKVSTFEPWRVLRPRPPKRKGSLGARAAESIPPKGPGLFGFRARGSQIRRTAASHPLESVTILPRESGTSSAGLDTRAPGGSSNHAHRSGSGTGARLPGVVVPEGTSTS